MIYTLCTSGQILSRAGKKVSSEVSGAMLDNFYLQAEGQIIGETRMDWVTGYDSTVSGVQTALNKCCASLAAIPCIAYDLGSYTSRFEAAQLLNVNRDEAQQLLKFLREINKVNDIKSVS